MDTSIPGWPPDEDLARLIRHNHLGFTSGRLLLGVVWVYLNTTRRRGGGEMWASVVLKLAGGGEVSFSLPDGVNREALLSRLSRLLPWAAFGYSAENEARYRAGARAA